MLKSENERLKDIKNKLENDHDRENRKANDLQDELKNLHNNCRNKDAEIDRLTRSISDKDSTLLQLTEEINQYVTNIEVYYNNEQEMKKDYERKQEDTEALRKLIDEIRDENARLTNTNKSLGLEVADYLQALEKVRNDNRNLKDENMDLEKDNQDLIIDTQS